MTLKLSFVISAVDRATERVRSVNRSIDRMTEPVRRVRASFRSMIQESRFDRVSASMGKLRESMGGLMAVGGQLAGMFLVAGAAAAGVVMAILRITEAVDKSAETAKMLGMTTEEFQRLSYAAKMNGASEDLMGDSLRTLSKNMILAINGGKEMQAWFGRVGLSMAELKKMNAAEVFAKIADKFVAVGDASGNAEKKIALLEAVMGGSGVAMKNTLEIGSAGLKKFGDEAERLGVVVDGTTADAMGDFNDNIDRLKSGLFGVMARIATVAMPVLEGVVKRMTAWSVSNRELISTQVVAFVTRMARALPPFLDAVVQIATALSLLLGGLNSVAQALGGWDAVIVAISALLVGKLVWSLVLVGKAISGVGLALALTPFGWFMAAVAALAGGAYLIYKHWGPIKDWFAGLWTGVKESFSSSIDWIENKMMAIIRWFATKIVAVNKMVPDWAKKYTLSGMALNLVAENVQSLAAPAVPSAMTPNTKQNVNVGGTLKIQIDSAGQPRVTQLRSASPNLDLDVYTGKQMVNP